VLVWKRVEREERERRKGKGEKEVTFYLTHKETRTTTGVE
jgi:hypothetical protein